VSLKEKKMGKKTRNWIFAGIGLAVFVLGIPLAEQVIANANAPAAQSPALCSSHEAKPAMAHPSVIPLGDNYLQIIPTGDGSIGALLYDANFMLLGANENEAALSFSLPDGVKKSVKIAIPGSAALHGSAGDTCCATSAEGAKEGASDTCPHQGQDVAPEHQGPHVH